MTRKKRDADTAVYIVRNPAVATRIAEPFPGMPGEPLTFQVTFTDNFRGRVKIKDGGSKIVIECGDEFSKEAFMSAMEQVFMNRNLDERRWPQENHE